MSEKKYSDEQIIDAIRTADGNMTHAARVLGCWRSTLYKRMGESQAIRDAYDDINESVADEIEGNFIDVCRNPNHPGFLDATKFYLRTKARTRGYGDRLELAGDKDAPLKVVFEPAEG